LRYAADKRYSNGIGLRSPEPNAAAIGCRRRSRSRAALSLRRRQKDPGVDLRDLARLDHHFHVRQFPLVHVSHSWRSCSDSVPMNEMNVKATALRRPARRSSSTRWIRSALAALAELIAPFARGTRQALGGRPPFPIESMLRIRILQREIRTPRTQEKRARRPFSGSTRRKIHARFCCPCWYAGP